MININWGRQSGNASNPFQEIEMEMNGFRDSVRNSAFQHDNFIMSFDHEINNLISNSQSFMSLLPLHPPVNGTVSRNFRNNYNRNTRRVRESEIFDHEMDDHIDNTQNLMSFLPVQPSVNISGRRNVRVQNRHSGRYPQHTEFREGQDQSSLATIFSNNNENGDNHRRRRRLRNQADLNNHVFPAPRQDRQVWYDPNDPSVDNRLPQIPQRILTLSEIDRIPTKKVSECGKSCDICLDDFKKGDNSKVLNCKHYYHVSCVDPWLKQHPSCPKCRRQVRAPPENLNKPPHPIPPPCPVRERARAYDRERRIRIRNESNRRPNIQMQSNVQDVSELQNLTAQQNTVLQQNQNILEPNSVTEYDAAVSNTQQTRATEEISVARQSRALEENVSPPQNATAENGEHSSEIAE